MVDISTVGIVSVPKRSALETSCRELSEDVSFGIGTGTLLVVEQSRLEKPPKGRVTYTVVCGRCPLVDPYCILYGVVTV